MQGRPDLELFATLPVPLLVVRDDAVLFANRAVAELTGTPASALVATHALELLGRFVDPADVGWLTAIGEARKRGTEPPPALWTRMRDGRGVERHICVRMALLPGSAAEYLCVVTDAEGDAICRRLSDALTDAAARFMRCRDEGSVLACAVDALRRQELGVLVLVCEAGELRIGPSSISAHRRAACAERAGGSLDTVRVPLAEVPGAQLLMSGSRSFFVQDARVETPSLGTVRHLAEALLESPRVFAAPIPLEEGPFGILVVQGDALTPSAVALLEMFAGHVGAALENARHHKRAAERLSELTRLQGELVAQERAAAVGGAAAVLAHEVRNPLGAILNAVALLKRRNGRIEPEEMYRLIEEEAERIDQLIGDLLDLARPLEPRVREIELGPLVHRAIGTVLDDEADVAIEVLRGGGEGRLVADPHLVQVAVENLVRNAVQASPEGGRVVVRIGGDERGGAVEVEDEGPGIEGADAERIFEPFYTTRQVGKGLGLAVVKRVAEVHGGRVEVRRGSAGGSVFALRLPRNAAASLA